MEDKVTFNTEELRTMCLNSSVEELTDIIIELTNKLGELSKAAKIVEYYNKKQRPIKNKSIDDNELIRMYTADGLSVYGIAKLTGHCYNTIRGRLIRAGVYINGGHNRG